MNKQQLKEKINESIDTVLVVINGSDMVEFDGTIDDVLDEDDYLDEVDVISPETIIEEDGDLPYRCSRFNEQFTPDEIRDRQFYLLHHNTGYNQENQDAVFCI